MFFTTQGMCGTLIHKCYCTVIHTGSVNEECVSIALLLNALINGLTCLASHKLYEGAFLKL